MVVCNICNKEFRTKSALSSHIHYVHKKTAPTPTQTPEQTTEGQTTDINERLKKLEEVVSQLVKSNPKDPPDMGVEDIRLRAFELLEQGHTPVEIMLSLKVPAKEMKQILEEYNALYSLVRTGKSQPDYFLHIARDLGEQIRDMCPEYSEETGTCNLFNIYDIDPELRRSVPGLFKGVGGKVKFHVYNHSEICALCRRGLKRGE